MDLEYYAYLARTIPARELARAMAARARRALRGGLRMALERSGAKPLLFQVPFRKRTQFALAAPRPAIIDVSQREETARLLRERWPEACAFVLREAEACRRGELPVFGKWKDCRKGAGIDIASIDYHRDPISQQGYDPAQPGMEVDFLQPGADAKAVWEIGRLQHLWRFAQARWLAESEAERSSWARAWIETVRQFRADNRVGLGVQWSCAMEVSARVMHAAMSFAYIQDDSAVDARVTGELFDFLEEHCLYIEDHLEETGAIRTNHYAADLVGLVVVGALFPELGRSRVWLREFGAKLWEEIPRQCRPDGTHFESSMGYQRLCAELFLAAVLAARAGGAPAPREVERTVAALFRSIADVLNPSGNIPQIGDLDSCRGLPLMPRAPLDCQYLPALGAAALRDARLRIPGIDCPVEVAWLLGPDGVRRFEALGAEARTGSVELGDAGIAVLRKAGGWLCLSAGPNGQGGTGGHAHNDKNGIELSWDDLDLVVDRGTFVYARDPRQRDARRGTAGHSTVQVDGLEQNRIIPGRLFALPDKSRARILRLERKDGVELATGEHHGYQKAGVLHRRVGALHGEARAAAIVDELYGSGSHALTLRWHVPHTDLVLRPADAAEGARLEKLHDAGLSFGYDLRRCVAVRRQGKEVALFAFGATLPWKLSILESDTSPGYAELRPARTILLDLSGEVPARLFTAVLILAHPSPDA
jgi:hypothetical protein